MGNGDFVPNVSLTDPNASAVPVASPAPIAAPAAAPVAANPTAAPAAQMNPTDAAAYAQSQQANAGVQTAAARLAQLNQPEVEPVQTRHARLLNMIQGLAIGLSAAGTAIGTHGAEGGAPQVAQVQGELQRQRLAAKQQALDAKNQEIQHQLVALDTNMKVATMAQLMSSIPDDMAERHVKLAQEQQTLATGAQQAQIQLADFMKQNWGFAPAEITGAQSGQPGAAVDPAHIQQAQTMLSRLVGDPNDPNTTGAIAILGKDNPAVQTALAVAANPGTGANAVKAVMAAGQGLALGLQQHGQVVEAKTKGAQETTAEVGAATAARPKDLNDATGRLIQVQQAYKTNPTPETKAAVDAAQTAQSAFLAADRQQKQIAQDIQNGDPEVIAESLVNGVYAPSQVLSARSMSKPFYSEVVARANAYAKAQGLPEIPGPNGQHTGEYYNAATAEGQFKYSTNVQTQNTLNKILTLNNPGGDLDILKDATTALPKMDSKTINKIFNAGATEFGSPEATNYHMALYNLAGLLAQVQTGGIPTEGEIQQQLNLMSAANSKGQLDGAIQIARRDIAARGASMVNNNVYLRQQYPSLAQTQQQPQAAPAGATGKAPGPDGKWYYHDAKGNNLGLAQ